LKATTAATTSPIAAGIATGIAMRATRFRFLRRRHAERLPETMGFHLYVRSCSWAETLGQAAPADQMFHRFKSLRSRNNLESFLNEIFPSDNVAGSGTSANPRYRTEIEACGTRGGYR
jgi:hypothetical protein